MNENTTTTWVQGREVRYIPALIGEYDYLYSLSELEEMPTLSEGQADDLKIEEDGVRVWLSRCGIEDGEWCDHKVSIEMYCGRRWVVVKEYEAL